MTFVTLFSNEHGFIASDQIVFAPNELKPLANVIEQAQLLDQRLAEQANHEHKVLADAREQGRVEGLAQGRSDAHIQVATLCRELNAQHTQTVEQVRSSCAELAVDMVRKIAGNVDSAHWLLAQAEQAAEDVLDQPIITLRVHTSQAQAVRALMDESVQSRIHSVVADDALTEQACILDTGHGQIDVGLETQLHSILKVFDDDAPRVIGESDG